MKPLSEPPTLHGILGSLLRSTPLLDDLPLTSHLQLHAVWSIVLLGLE